MRITFLKALPVLLAALAGACSSTSEMKDEQLMQLPISEDLSIVFGEGGGVTGRWTGHAIDAEGREFGWDGMEVGANQSEQGTLSTAALGALLARIEESGFYADEQAERGNLTRMVRITRDGETHEVTWVPQLDLSDPGSENAADALMALLVEAVASA